MSDKKNFSDTENKNEENDWKKEHIKRFLEDSYNYTHGRYKYEMILDENPETNSTNGEDRFNDLINKCPTTYRQQDERVYKQDNLEISQKEQPITSSNVNVTQRKSCSNVPQSVANCSTCTETGMDAIVQQINKIEKHAKSMRRELSLYDKHIQKEEEMKAIIRDYLDKKDKNAEKNLVELLKADNLLKQSKAKNVSEETEAPCCSSHVRRPNTNKYLDFSTSTKNIVDNKQNENQKSVEMNKTKPNAKGISNQAPLDKESELAKDVSASGSSSKLNKSKLL